ncbi:MAG: hypothetical protein HQK55_12680 [Deltaproteobacteria bacterium]|nr:hypothetical protein [Deltaproteobacteria bacterium]
MTNKNIFAVIAIILILAAGSWAMAAQDSPAAGQGSTYGGPRGRGGPGFNMPMDEATIKLQGQLYMKKLELRALLAAPQVDEAKATALHAEVTKLKDEVAQKRFAAMLDFKKKNPDWQPRLGHGGAMGGSMAGGGMGMGCR